MCAVLVGGCGGKKEAESPTVEIADPILEEAIRKELFKQEGELTQADLEKVTGLVLDGNQLTDVKGLEKLTQLEYLSLVNNQLTSVKGLERLTKLEGLFLSNNQLTDVKGLEKLKQLEYLELDDNRALTKAQIDELQKALPNCEIDSTFTK